MSLSGCCFRVSRNVLLKNPNANFGKVIARYSKIWEPDYLILAKTKTPEYDLINFQLKGYDFAILEQFQKFVRRLAKKMDIVVNKTWASPSQDFLIHHYKPESTDVLYKYNMRMSERNVQVVDVKSHIMALFIEAVLTACPPGVNISIHEHQKEMDEIRYIPDYNILELEKQLKDFEKKKGKKKA